MCSSISKLLITPITHPTITQRSRTTKKQNASGATMWTMRCLTTYRCTLSTRLGLCTNLLVGMILPWRLSITVECLWGGLMRITRIEFCRIVGLGRFVITWWSMNGLQGASSTWDSTVRRPWAETLLTVRLYIITSAAAFLKWEGFALLYKKLILHRFIEANAYFKLSEAIFQLELGPYHYRTRTVSA